MDRKGFKNRMKQYKKAREENPGLKYWEWKSIPKYDEGTSGVLDKNKVYNRVKGDLIGNIDYSIVDAIGQYLFNEDSTVDEYIKTIKSAKDKYSNYNQNELDSLVTDAHKKYLKYLRASKDRSKTSPEYKDYSEKFDASRANFIMTHEDAKDLYLGLPQRSNTVIQSKYKPSVGDTSQTYYTFTPLQHETAFQKPIVDAYNNMLQNKVFKVVDDGKFLGLSISTPEIENADSNVIDIPKQNRAVAKIPLFGSATVSTGVDPNKGQYVSVYDVWDYNTAIANKHGDNVGKYIGGTPFELYDRIYLDDYYGVNSQPNKGDYYAGYLPEVKVTPKKYAEGSQVEPDPLDVLERSRPKVAGIPINDRPLSGTDPLGELYLNLVSGNAVRKAVANGVNGMVRKSFYNNYKELLKAGWNRQRAYDYASPELAIDVLPGIAKGFDYTLKGANYTHAIEDFVK